MKIYKTIAIRKSYTGVVLTFAEALGSPTLPGTNSLVVSAAIFTTVADSEMVIRGALTGVTGTGLETTPTAVDDAILATSFDE